MGEAQQNNIRSLNIFGINFDINSNLPKKFQPPSTGLPNSTWHEPEFHQEFPCQKNFLDDNDYQTNSSTRLIQETLTY